MIITKPRLLQIIREEVELHEKKLEENFLEIDHELLKEMENLDDPSTTLPYPTKDNGRLSDEHKKEILTKAGKNELEEENLDDDIILSPKKDKSGKRKIVQPTNGIEKLEIKIR